jgi:tetratricopeptide (TPR) repeat protein
MAADGRDVPVSMVGRRAIDGMEAAHLAVLEFRDDPIAIIDGVLAENPDFIMGHVFKAGMLTQAMETRIYGTMVAALEAAEALSSQANDRERGHIAAVRAWVDGEFYQAVQHWEAVLVEHPRDLLALNLAHQSSLLLGDTTGMRDVVTRVLHAWDESVPGYGFVLGMLSFGYEECRDFSAAEEAGRWALAMNSKDAWAIHSVAHVMEMQGRQAGGIRWMIDRREDWAPGNFANHLWWHQSLFHLDLGQYDQVLEIYDYALRSEDPANEKYEELDAAALLWRLNLLGVDVGDRWSALADKWEPSATDTLYAFNDVHAMIAFVADGREAAAAKVLGATERYADNANDANVAMTRIIGLPFCRALKAFAEEKYGEAVDLLMPVRYLIHRLGGSRAQRDILAWTLIEAALRAGRYKLALALSSERLAIKPSSPQNWAFEARALEGLGEIERAVRSRAKAESLFSGSGISAVH